MKYHFVNLPLLSTMVLLTVILASALTLQSAAAKNCPPGEFEINKKCWSVDALIDRPDLLKLQAITLIKKYNRMIEKENSDNLVRPNIIASNDIECKNNPSGPSCGGNQEKEKNSLEFENLEPNDIRDIQSQLQKDWQNDQKFSQSSFMCLDDRRICTEKGYPYISCELAMVVCTLGSIVK